MRRGFLYRALSCVLVGPMVWLPIAAYADELPEVETIADEPIELPVAEDEAPALDEEALRDFAERAQDVVTDSAPYTAPTPSGAEGKSAATPQAISLPKAEGSIEGMGESFSPVLSSGTGTFTVPIALPPGRAGVTPSLALSYSSSGGASEVGFGWSFGAPFIGRQTDRGVPRYVDGAAWHAQEDRFFYNAGQELVPVNSAAAELADCGSAGCAPVPADLAGWQQYRARVEGGYQRFFRSPDSRRWVVQSKAGSRFDFGALPVGEGPSDLAFLSLSALQSESPLGAGRIFRWYLTRTTDPHGSATYFTYLEDQGARFLQHVHYLSPHGACGALTSAPARMRCNAPLSNYGRRVRVVYEDRADVLHSYVAGWGVHTAKRVRRIEVTSATGSPGARSLARRYHLSYDPDSFYSLLASVQIEGRPSAIDSAGVSVGVNSVDEASLGDAIVGTTLPPMRFSYSAQPDSPGAIPGFGGVDPTTHTATDSPPHSVDEARADLFDVNSDGLADLIVTSPAHYDGGVGVFFNGFTGAAAAPADHAGAFSDAVVMPIPTGLSSVMTLSNANVAPMDIDGDGRSDLLHMPRLANYGYFTPARDVPPGPDAPVSPAEQGWRWAYVPRALPAGELDPRIDFTGDAPLLRAFDVNNDHLVDVVKTTGTSIQTWLNLGWLPGGDGRFGSATYDGTTWHLSTAPIERCLPIAGTPVDFSSSEIKLADLDGDGLQDIVRIRPGSLIYWPGRGNGSFGEGPSDCAPGFAGGRHITVANPPAALNAELDGVYLADVNADGASDVVQVRFTAIDVWFNQAGSGFTDRVIATGTPHAPAFLPRVRLVDIDGSGTVDVLYGNAGNWRWVDLMGGARPRLLVGVSGSLGAQTELTYASSVEDYLADLRDAETCIAGCERFTWDRLDGVCDGKISGECVYRSGGSPVVSTVIRQVVTSDRMHLLGLTEHRVTRRYAYHDGYYEGIEQEFRGFGAADEEAVGDATHPTGFSRTYFHQGRRPSELASDRLADNPDEALKGHVYLTESSSDAAMWAQTSHRTLTLRTLHTGLDGRAVKDAVETQSDTLTYDVGGFQYSGAPLSLPGVIRGAETENHELIVRGAGWAHMRATVNDVDAVGNVLLATKHGRIRGEFAESLPDETIVAHAVADNIGDWMWRLSESWIDGHGNATDLAKTTRAFNETGDEIASTVDVTQGTLYAFGALGSPAPEDLVVTSAYDVWGNVTAACAGGQVSTGTGCLRHRSVAYDTDWATFPVSEAQAVRRNASGFDTLVTTATWDTALGLIVSVADPNEDTSTVTYDGLGRLTSVTAPPVIGCSAGVLGARLEYHVTPSPETQPLSRVTTVTRTSCTSASAVLEAHAYVDGLGRARAALATGDGGAWIKSGVVTFDLRGGVNKSYHPIAHTASPTSLSAAVALPPSSHPHTQVSYDAFDRPVVVVAEDGSLTVTVYRALSQEIWDPLDLDTGSDHYGTPTITRTDGHGRVIDQILINRQPGASSLEYYRLWTEYRADGAVVRVERAETTSSAARVLSSIVSGHTVVRTFDYDTAGRRVGTTDPDTDGRVSGDSWRYLFNRVNDLVAVRDPRGCGQDFYYDHGGRPLGERYIACAEAQPHEQPIDAVPAGSIGWTETTAAASVDVLHAYDSYASAWDPTPGGFDDYPSGAAGVLGRLVATSDRGQRSIVAYDRRGNLIWQARQLALIPTAGSVPATLTDPLPATPAAETPAASGSSVAYDEDHTYVVTRAYDHAGRATALVLPRDPDFAGTAPKLAGRLAFNARGLPASATIDLVANPGAPSVADGVITWGAATVSSQTVVASIAYNASGLPLETTYGDDLGSTRDPTVSTLAYDSRLRPVRATTAREATETAVPPDRPLGAVTVPFDQEYDWDPASNLIGILDHRLATEWPAGHRPQSVEIDHDALYRVTSAAYSYSQDSGPSTTSDLGTDWRTAQAQTRPADPMRTEPAPLAPALPDGRVVDLQWAFDWLGNMTFWTDDAHAFYERSIGSITNGTDVTDGRPSALYVASDLTGPPADRGGYLELAYGDGGNVLAMTVHAQCVDVSPGTCAASSVSDCLCAVEQHYQYLWDELNRLSDARRYDRTGGTGSWILAIRQRYRYDGANRRTLKQTLHPDPPGTDPTERTALYIYPGDFERRGLVTGTSTYDASSVLGTETQYLLAGARIVWQPGSPTTGLDPDHRITIPISDLIGTTTAVLDLRTGDLVETSTYYPNGARETFATTLSALVPSEPQGFTTKEADDEVGLVYFGERYLIPRAARWASPDPLAIHALGGGEAMNSYHYVAGEVLQARDPLGLDLWGNEARENRTEREERDAQGIHVVEGKYESSRDGQPISFDAAVYHGAQPIGYLQYLAGTRGNDFWIRSFDMNLNVVETSYVGVRPEGMSTRDYVALAGAGAGAVPYVGDWVSLGVSVGLFVDDPSWEGAADVGLDLVGAVLPGVPAMGSIRRAEKVADVADALLDARRAVVAAGSRLSHINAAIAEAHGWQRTLDAGHLPIQGPGHVSAPGPDFITYNPKSQSVILWDAKYRGPGGSYPSSIPADKLKRWTPEARKAVEALPDSQLKAEVLNALAAGRIKGDVFKWPQ